jgi:hypothetical protein
VITAEMAGAGDADPDGCRISQDLPPRPRYAASSRMIV